MAKAKPVRKVDLDMQRARHTKTITERLLSEYNRVLRGPEVDGQHVGLEWVYESPYHFGEKVYNGNMRLYLGYGRDKTSYRTLSDGTMRYADIATKLNNLYLRALKNKEYFTRMRATFDANIAIRNKLTELYDVKPYLCPINVDLKTSKLYFKVNDITEEEAKALLNLAKELGLLKNS